MSEAQALPQQGNQCEHLYHVVAGRHSFLRYCERCGKSDVMEGLENILDRHTRAYFWTRISESREAAGRMLEAWAKEKG